MIRTDVAMLLESGGSSVVGTVDAGGLPDACRAWGAAVRGDRLRFLLSASATRSLENLRAGGPVAFTMTEVVSLRSVQVKGRAVAVEPADSADRRRSTAYIESFVANVHAADGSPVELLRNLVPAEVVAVECTIDDVYDQTPGPRAGTRLGAT